MAARQFEQKNSEESYDSLFGIGLVFSLLLLVGLSIYWGGDRLRLASAAEDLRARRIERGQAIYAEQCTACHGVSGEGGVGPALNNRQVLKDTPDEIFFSVIRSGVPNTQMPSWSIRFEGALNDQQINDLVNYLVSTQDEEQVPFEKNLCTNPEAVDAAIEEFLDGDPTKKPSPTDNVQF